VFGFGNWGGSWAVRFGDAGGVLGRAFGHVPIWRFLKFSVKVVRHRIGLWKAVEKY
jgi:hypothetical protein